MSQYFSSKDPAEKVVLTFDFSADLYGVEVLSGVPTVVVTSVFSADPSPASVLNGSASFDATNTLVYQGVQGGVDGTDYTFKVTCNTTNMLKVLVRDAILPVLSA